MPVFELEMGGRTFEIEAPDMDAALNAVGQMGTPSDEMPQTGESSFDAFSRAAANRFADNLLSVPDAVVTGLANAVGSPKEMIRPLLGGPLPGQETGGETGTLFEDITGTPPPRVGERVLPIPRMEDIHGAIDVVTGEAGSMEESRRAREALAEQSPTATFLGQLFGDAATIFTGRAPFQKAIRRAPGRAPARNFPPGLRKQIDHLVRSKVSKGVGRGLKRAAEAGLEGASLAVLSEGDPQKVAAFAAGGQMANSMALTLVKHPLKGLAPAALAATAVIQLTKETIPGGKDFILESGEKAFREVRNILALGLIAGLTGGGRLSNTALSKNLPKITDAITSLPRGAVISLINDLTRDDDARKVVETFSRNPNAFGPKATRKLKRAIMNEKVSLSDTVSQLMRDQRFRVVIEETPPTAS